MKKLRLTCALLLGAVGVALFCLREAVFYSYQVGKPAETQHYHVKFGTAGLACIAASAVLILTTALKKSSTAR